MSSSVLIELGLQDALESPVIAFELLSAFRSMLVIVRIRPIRLLHFRGGGASEKIDKRLSRLQNSDRFGAAQEHPS